MSKIGVTRTYGFQVEPHHKSPSVGMLKCPMCGSLDVAVSAEYPHGGSGPRINNADCEHCGHVGTPTVDRPGGWGVFNPPRWSDDDLEVA